MESIKNNFIRKSNKLENKEKQLQNARQEIDQIADKLGLGIENGIKETVSVLRAMNFSTSSSCAGHTENDKYSPPYIEFYSPAPLGWKDDKMKKVLWKQENIKQVAKLEQFLNEFYINRKSPPDAKLQLENIGMFGGFRLENLGGRYYTREQISKLTKEEIIYKIKLYQKEMSNFTNFLEDIFLNSQ